MSSPGDATDRNRFERWSFAGVSDDLDVSATFGWYPNLEVADTSVTVVVDGHQRTVHASERLRADGVGSADIGPVHLGPSADDGSRRLVVDGAGLGLSCDLELAPTAPAVDEPAHRQRRGDVPVVHAGRAVRRGTWSGAVVVDGARREVGAATAVLSRSGGVRPLADAGGGAPALTLPQVFWWHLVVCSPSGSWLVATGTEDAGGTSGAAALAGEDGTVVAGARLAPVWASGTRRARQAALDVGGPTAPPPPDGRPGPSADGRPAAVLALDLDVVRWSPLRALGHTSPDWPHGRWHGEDVVGVEDWRVGDLDPTDVHHLLGRHVVRARLGDDECVGVLDLLALGPHEPSGLTGFTDPAR